MGESSKIIPIVDKGGFDDFLTRLEKLEDSLLSDLRDLRAIKTELQRRSGESPTLEKLLDVKEVAGILGQPERWVYNQARAKELPAVRLGKYLKFSPSALHKWLERKSSD